MYSLRSINHHRLLRVVLLLWFLATAGHAHAQVYNHDFDLRVGKGTTLTEPVRRSIFLSKPIAYFSTSRELVIVYLDQNVSLSEQRRGLDVILGVSPMARIEFSYDIPRFSVEAGVGVNVISTREMSGRQLGSNLLFSPTVTAGLEIPWASGFLGVFYMFRHLSNASMFEDNDGINFQYIVFSMRFGNF